MTEESTIDEMLARVGFVPINASGETLCVGDPRSTGLADVSLSPEHFRRVRDEAAKRRLFKQSVRLVEIETFSYCNRACWFCANSFIDRKSANDYLDENVYLRIIGCLREIDYAGQIFYGRYNEPLADRIILRRLEQARAAAPRATLSTFTNGDYLTRTLLEELYARGLRQLHVSVYLGDALSSYQDSAGTFYADRMVARMEQICGRIGVTGRWETQDAGRFYFISAGFEDMQIHLHGRNYAAIGNNRGGLVTAGRQSGSRVSPCWSPFSSIYIDYNGNMVPCCVIRSDAPSHAGYAIGNLRDGRSIFDLFADSVLVDWRRSLFQFNPRGAPCETCDRQDRHPATDWNLGLIDRITRRMTPADDDGRAAPKRRTAPGRSASFVPLGVSAAPAGR